KSDSRPEVVLVQLLDPASEGRVSVCDHDAVEQIAGSFYELSARRIRKLRCVCRDVILGKERGQDIVLINRCAVELIAQPIVELQIGLRLPGILSVELGASESQVVGNVKLRLAVRARAPEQKVGKRAAAPGYAGQRRLRAGESERALRRVTRVFVLMLPA